jgi:hypothetical protein
MVIAMFPLMNWIILPLAYMYPRKLLCRQFWTIEQQLSFGEISFDKTQKHCPELFNNLGAFIDTNLANDNKAKYIALDCINKVNFYFILFLNFKNITLYSKYKRLKME